MVNLIVNLSVNLSVNLVVNFSVNLSVNLSGEPYLLTLFANLQFFFNKWHLKFILRKKCGCGCEVRPS